MAEGYVMEILNDDSNPCGPGDIGRIIVTDLHNFATPLIRYDTGDYAEVAPPCPCGRGLPSLQRIVGRERNMAVVEGSRRWPQFGFDHFLEIAPIVQYQVVQSGTSQIELRLVCHEPLTSEQKQRLTHVIRTALNHPFDITFKFYAERIPPSGSGKFEEFLCLVTP